MEGSWQEIPVDIWTSLLGLYNVREARIWLDTPQPLMGDKSAIELIKDGKADEVRRLIKQVEDGVYL
jgi:uncharacterized protein (DUF2384 family)